MHRASRWATYLFISSVFFVPAVAFASTTITSITANGSSGPLTITPGSTVTLLISGSNSSNGDHWRRTGWAIATSAPSSFTGSNCVDTIDQNGSGAVSVSLSITAPTLTGTYNVYAQAFQDSAASCTSSNGSLFSTSSSLTIATPDTTSPSSSVTSTGAINGYASSSPLVVNFSSSDNVGVASTSLLYRFMSGVYTFFASSTGTSGFYNFTFPNGEGTYNFYTIASDAAGNTEAAPGSADATVIYDKTAPASPIIDSGPANPINTTHFSFNFHDTEGGVTFLCRVVSDPYATCTSPFSGTTAEGSREFDVEAKDAAGNVSSPTTYLWTVDVTAPTLSVNSQITSNATPTITGTSNDTALVGVTIDGHTYYTTPVAGSWSVNVATSLSAPGTFSVTASSTDSAGNVGSASGSLTYNTTAPLLTLTGTSGISSSTSASFNFSSTAQNGTSIVSQTCTLDSTSQDCTGSSSAAFAGLAEGSHTFSFSATDDATNTATSSLSFTVDLTAPHIVGTPADKTVEATGSTTPVTFTTPDATDAVDGTDAVSCVPSSGSSFALGSTTVTCSSTDTAGNMSTTTFVVGVIDTTPPVITLTGGATLTLTVGDTFTDPGASAFDLVDGTTTVITTGGVNTAAVGTYTLTYTSTDSSGNAASTTRSVTVNAAAPAPSSGGGGGGGGNGPIAGSFGVSNSGGGNAVIPTPAPGTPPPTPANTEGANAGAGAGLANTPSGAPAGAPAGGGNTSGAPTGAGTNTSGAGQAAAVGTAGTTGGTANTTNQSANEGAAAGLLGNLHIPQWLWALILLLVLALAGGAWWFWGNKKV